MSDKDDVRTPGHSFSRYILIWMIVLVLCVVGFLTVNDYLFTKSNFEHEEGLLRIQTEQNIEEAIRLKDALWNTYDASLNVRMNDGLELVLDEYECSARDPARMDLAGLKNQIGDDYDIYVIDENGVIAYTTYAPELGMDFRTIPSFYKYLTTIRSSEGFFPDRIVNELMGEGKFRKYAYMPTPDHKYVLELGLVGQTFENINGKVEVNDNIDTIVALNPYVDHYRVFNTLGRQSEDNRLPEPEVQQVLSDVIRTRSTIEVSDPDQALTRRYLFIDLDDSMYGSDPSRIVEITYSDNRIQEALDRLLLVHLLTGAGALIFGCVIAFLLSRKVTRPIQEIVSDVETISRGDLEYRIRPTENREFAILASGINTMVDSLRSALTKMKDDDIFKNEVIDQMPVGIFIKRVDTGEYVFWNRKSEKLFGRPATEVVGRTDRDLFPESIITSIEKEDNTLIRHPGEVHRKLQQSPDPQAGVIKTITVTILDSAGRARFILGICEDVSQENINLKMDLLFSLTRQEILDHLSVIMNHLERAQLKNSPDEIQTFFIRTLNSISSIRSQITSMRTLQDLGLIRPKWQSVHSVFADAQDLLSPDHHAEIITDVGDYEFFTDPIISRAIYRLLDFSLRMSGNLPLTIRVSARESGDTLHIMYHDTGPGIPDQEKEEIFSFGHEAGLYILREVLGYTGISITEIGVPGKGCIFDIRVPKDRFRKN